MATEATMPQTETPVVPPPPANGQAMTAPKTTKERIQVHFNPDDPASFYMDTGIFEQMQRVAMLMARSSLVPVHLRGEDKASDCFLVTAQAFRWRMDPFSVAQHTFVLKGKLGYEGKLIAAIINASGKLEGNLAYRYTEGPGPSRKVEVVGRLKGEKAERTVVGTVDQWSTDNEMWRKDPDQILSYRGAREWARRHMPEAVLGIHAEEELPSMAGVPVEMTRGAAGTFEARPTHPPVKDALLESIGIGSSDPVPSEFVLVDPVVKDEPQKASPAVDPKDCTHPLLPPSRLKPGKTMSCPDCWTDLTGPTA